MTKHRLPVQPKQRDPKALQPPECDSGSMSFSEAILTLEALRLMMQNICPLHLQPWYFELVLSGHRQWYDFICGSTVSSLLRYIPFNSILLLELVFCFFSNLVFLHYKTNTYKIKGSTRGQCGLTSRPWGGYLAQWLRYYLGCLCPKLEGLSLGLTQLQLPINVHTG